MPGSPGALGETVCVRIRNYGNGTTMPVMDGDNPAASFQYGAVIPGEQVRNAVRDQEGVTTRRTGKPAPDYFFPVSVIDSELERGL